MPSILGANTLSSGFDVANSLRFNDDDSAYLDKTPSGDGSRVKWTWSGWVKRSTLGAIQGLFVVDTGSAESALGFLANDTLRFYQTGQTNGLVTNAVFRDPAAWYHIVLIFDSSNGTASDRMQLWVNGVRTAEADIEDTTFKDAQNYNSATNKASYVTYLGRVSTNTAAYFDGYMAEVVFQNDNADSPVDKFGEFDEDSGIWKPIDVSGLTFGTNGFYLDFENSGSLGADVSGNGNNFTVNNLTAIDQSTDTCTNNFATLNPLDGNLGDSLCTEGNLKFDTNTGSNKPWSRSTIGVSSGKWYFEAKLITAANNQAIGISDRPSPDHNSTELGAGAFDYSYQSANSGDKYNNGSQSSYGNTYGANDIVSCALDLDNNKVYFGKNGTFQNSGNPTNGTNPAFTITAPSLTNHGFYFFCLADLTGSNKSVWESNFGSPSFTISSGNTDGNGYGNFEYAVPRGYYALNTKNLAEFG